MLQFDLKFNKILQGTFIFSLYFQDGGENSLKLHWIHKGIKVIQCLCRLQRFDFIGTFENGLDLRSRETHVQHKLLYIWSWIQITALDTKYLLLPLPGGLLNRFIAYRRRSSSVFPGCHVIFISTLIPGCQMVFLNENLQFWFV